MSTRFLTADELSAIDKWYVIDAADQILGRVATKAADDRMAKGVESARFSSDSALSDKLYYGKSWLLAP